MLWQPFILFLLVAVVLVAAALGRRIALVPAERARRCLKEGALIIDVRGPEEFQQGHVAGALNMPLPGLPANVLRSVPQKDRMLLLHCLGGGRSAVAKRRLIREGYTRVFNLGSYRRAERLAAAGSPERAEANPKPEFQ
jgi:phage shock protein E